MRPGKKLLVWFAGKCLLVFFFLTITGCGDKNTGSFHEKPEDNPPAKYRLVVAGSGSNLGITRKLAKAYMVKNPEVSILIPESLGSTGGIKSVSEGVIDIGLVSRKMFPEEEKLALTYIPYARIIIVFAVNPNLTIDNLTHEQLSKIYSGKITNWKQVGGPDREIIVLTREKTDSSRLIWNRLIKGFQDLKERPDAILLRTDQAMNESIASIENSIGWTDMGAIQTEKLEIRPLKLNGVNPSFEMAVQGKYPYLKELAFVTKANPGKVAVDFINFVNGPEGEKILLESGCIPAVGH